MPGPWVQDAVLLARFAGLLGKDPAALPAAWPGLVSEANKQAANAVAEILGGKGYTDAQLSLADNRVRWNTQLGLYFAFLETGAVMSVQREVVDRYDIRQELRDVAVVLIGGILTAPSAPAGTDVGGISSGTLTARQTLLDDADRRGWFS